MRYPFFVLLFLFILPQFSLAQPEFADAKALPHIPALGLSETIETADMDGDGDRDIVIGFRNTDVKWIENENGDGRFLTVHPVAEGSSLQRISDIHVADIDGDGDNDIIRARSSNRITAYKNVDSKGTFEEEIFITSDIDNPSSINTMDVDGDSDLDLIVAAFDSRDLFWLENLDGLGTFSEAQLISSTLGQPKVIKPADIDGDGFTDVVSASNRDQSIAWHQNIEQTGNFEEASLIDSTGFDIEDIFPADLDGDGDIDIAFGNTARTIGWYENVDGMGSFGEANIISEGDLFPQSLHATDLDNDGDQDLLLASVQEETLVWYENLDGAGTFSEAITLSQSSDLIFQVVAGDLNGDNLPDVVTGGTELAWHQNEEDFIGAPRFIVPTHRFIGSLASADVDNDGDLDLLAASRDNNAAAWYENLDGNGEFGLPRSIPGALGSPVELITADLDGDQDADVIISNLFSGFGLLWFENLDDKMGFGEANVIRSVSIQATSIGATDIDSDGDNDVLATFNGQANWFENTDGAGTFGPAKTISTQSGITHALYADMDGDGDMDVVTAASREDRVSWYINIDGLFGFKQTLTTTSDFVQNILTADIDVDGDLDVIAASVVDQKVAWFENTDGAGTFGPEQIITTDYSRSTSLIVSDIDFDGDEDLIGNLGNNVGWFENLGEGLGFAPIEALVPVLGDGNALFTVDIDGDRDLDLFRAGSIAEQTIGWFENLTDPQSSVRTEEQPAAGLLNGFTLDQPYPNPFTQTTQFSLNVAQNQAVEVVVLNILGQQVTTLHDGFLLKNTQQQFSLNAENLPSGTYFISIKGEYFQTTQKVVVVR